MDCSRIRTCSLAQVRVDQRHRHTVKRQVPRGEPRVLPRIGHEDHVAENQVLPVAVAAVPALGAEAAADRDRLAASAARCSGRTACTTAVPRGPDAEPAARRRSDRPRRRRRRTRRLPPCVEPVRSSASSNGDASSAGAKRTVTVSVSPGASVGVDVSGGLAARASCSPRPHRRARRSR